MCVCVCMLREWHGKEKGKIQWRIHERNKEKKIISEMALLHWKITMSNACIRVGKILDVNLCLFFLSLASFS